MSKPIALTTRGLEIGFSSTGALEHLGVTGGANLLGAPALGRGIDVRLATHDWLGEAHAPVLLDHQTGKRQITLRVQLGPVVVHDIFTVDGVRLARDVLVENSGETELQLTGVRLLLPDVSLGQASASLFEAPGMTVRPRLPAEAIRNLPSPEAWVEEVAPAAADLWRRPLWDAPDSSAGLLAVHDPAARLSFLTWYHSEIEAATPLAYGDETGLTLGHELGLAGWLAPGGSLRGGTQFIEIHQGDWPSALVSFRDHYRRVGLVPPLYASPPAWVPEAAVYEVHPGPFGGFRGLTRQLPRIADLGFTVLYLLPVMRFDNRSGVPWDENWLGSGSPYAMLDFETFEESLGTEAEFIKLVEAAHRVGLKVLMDFVPQGCAVQSSYVTQHPEWFCRDESGGLVSSHGWVDTYSFDWANPEFQAYMLSWAKRFVEDYRIDGFRVDAPHGKEPNWARGLPYHASATNLGVLRLLEDLQKGIKAIRPDAALLCELFGPVFVRSHDFQYDYLPWAMLQALFRRRITSHEWGEWMRDYWAVQPPDAVRLTFTETHDTRVGTDAYAWRGSAAERSMFALLILAGFVPMVWAGQEAGLEAFYRSLLAARRTSSAIVHGERDFNAVPCDHADVVSVVCRRGGEVLWGVVSLHAERTPLRFDLSGVLQNVPGSVRFHDVLRDETWIEYGRETWAPGERDQVSLSLRPFEPCYFRVTPLEV